jgi:hypothetical protein
MADTISNVSSVLQSKKQNHVGESIPSQHSRKQGKQETIALSAEQVIKNNENKDLWEWVEVPDTDLFGEEHTGVSVNFQQFGPGKYFVSPEMAFEVKRLLANRMRGDIRVLQPRQDAVMARIMSKSQLGAPTNPQLDGLNDR